MKPLPRLCLALAALAAPALLADTPDMSAAPVKKVLFFSKSSGFEHDAIKLKMKDGRPGYAYAVLRQLGASNHIEFTFSKDGSRFTPEYLAQFDGFCFYTTGDLTKLKSDPRGDGNPPMTPEGKAALLDAIYHGKAFVGIHSATDTFHSPGSEEPNTPGRYAPDGDRADPYIKMIGAEFIMHGAQQPSHQIVVDPAFPGMSAVPADFAPTEEWYTLKDFAPDLHVLLVQDTAGMKGPPYARPPFPSTWAHRYGQGRVFYTSMGHREDIWNGAVFQSVLAGGLNWALGRVDADLTPNLASAAPQADVLEKFVPPAPKAKKAAARPLPLLGLARVAIRVSDLDAARHFYHDVGGFEEADDAKGADGAVQAAFFKVNDQQFIEILPGLTADETVPMMDIAIRTDRLKALRSRLASLGLDPSEIATDLDGSEIFKITTLPGQNLGALEFVQYVPGSLADRTRGRFLGPKRLSQHLEHAGIIAKDFDPAYRFYVDTLGFHEVWRRVTNDQSKVIIDHIAMPGTSGDFVELSNQTGSRNLNRARAGTAAHFALEVPDIQGVVAAARARDPSLRFVPPHYGLDNRWNFNLFDPDKTRMEFMQAEDPANPTPAVAVTPADFKPNTTGPAVPSWMLPGSHTHKQVPPPADYHRPSVNFDVPIGIFEGQSDIGSPLISGSAHYDDATQTYRIRSAGYNVFYTHDEFRYLWKRMSGDVSLAATVKFPQAGFGDRKVVFIIRQDLSDGCKEVMTALHGAGLIHLAQRPEKDALVKAVYRINPPKRPAGEDPMQVPPPEGERIGIEKHGDSFALWVSLHGEPMHQVGTVLNGLHLEEPFYVGIGFCSHTPDHPDTVILSDVVLENAAGQVH